MRMSGVSGSENHLAELARVLAADGWVVDVLIATPDAQPLTTYVSGLRDHCRAVEVMPMPLDFSPRLIRALRTRLRADYSVVHTHLVHADWHAAVAVAAAGGGRRAALVSTKHNHDPFRQRRLVRRLEGAATQRFDRVIAISDSLRRFTEQTAGVRASTVRYGLAVPLGVAAQRSSGELLAVGRLEPQKGVDILLSAMREVVREVPAARLLIAGEGTQRRALEGFAQDLGVAEHVEFLGQRSDVAQLMAGCALFVHAARWEGFGLVMLEAMAAEVAIVATAVGGVVEIVVDGETGTLVPGDDPRALASAILALLREPARARAMAAAGRRRLETHFNPERMGRETVKIYEEALRERGSA
jgi:glycosyltransferase involved in cell wall biosynthesis